MPRENSQEKPQLLPFLFRYRRVIWVVVGFIVGGSIFNKILQLQSLHDLSNINTTYYWAALFYGYTLLPLALLTLPAIGLGLATYFAVPASSNIPVARLTLGFWLVMLPIGLGLTCIHLGTLLLADETIRHEDTVVAEGHRYQLAYERFAADMDCAGLARDEGFCSTTLHYYACRCDKLGFKCDCVFLDSTASDKQFDDAHLRIDATTGRIYAMLDDTRYIIIAI